MEWYNVFSKELSLSYFMQNEDLGDEELEECWNEDKTIVEGILMSLLMDIDCLESLEVTNNGNN